MTDNRLSLFCLCDGESTSNAFSVKVATTDTIDDLKEAIKVKKTPKFDDIATDELTLWRVSVPVIAAEKHDAVALHALDSKEELLPTDELSDVFTETPPKKTIHIIVQRPPQGDLHTDIKKITDKFFAPGPIAEFLVDYAKGRRHLPSTSGPLEGLPTVGRRQFGKPPETRPSLLFLDLPDPTVPGSASRNLASASILDKVKDNNRAIIPVFGVSGCGKTRSVLELLCQHWGFYFNGSSDDWGSNDVTTLLSTVQEYLYDHDEPRVSKLVRDVYEEAKGSLLKSGCLPTIKDDTRLLVVHDEAQLLGDALSGSFQSMSSSDESPRPLLSPILHAFRNIGEHQLTLVTCGTGLSINTLFWIQSSGSGLKDKSKTFECK
ncbi:hypothetical protein BGZ82_002729 [Podila clonocystis]|nr:hypothetical protein BGZ82_002729 [Podila clonocystis]